MKNKLNKTHLVQTVLLAGIIIVLAGSAQAQELLTKPAWLPQLSLGVKESYDDNILGVSGNGMQPKGSWVTAISPAIGFEPKSKPVLDTLRPSAAREGWSVETTAHVYPVPDPPVAFSCCE